MRLAGIGRVPQLFENPGAVVQQLVFHPPAFEQLAQQFTHRPVVVGNEDAPTL